MNMMRCKNGHYYDAKRTSSCPYCKNLSQDTVLVNNNINKSDKTKSLPNDIKKQINLDETIAIPNNNIKTNIDKRNVSNLDETVSIPVNFNLNNSKQLNNIKVTNTDETVSIPFYQNKNNNEITKEPVNKSFPNFKENKITNLDETVLIPSNKFTDNNANKSSTKDLYSTKEINRNQLNNQSIDSKSNDTNNVYSYTTFTDPNKNSKDETYEIPKNDFSNNKENNLSKYNEEYTVEMSSGSNINRNVNVLDDNKTSIENKKVTSENKVIYQINESNKRDMKNYVGWIVCIDGYEKGMEYRIKDGENLIGRGDEMDICIKGDNTISRNYHAKITYKNTEVKFYFEQGNNRDLIYINDKEVTDSTILKAYDIIEFANVKLMFIPLCGEMFKWN